jgi:hypothetical protein
MGDACLAIWQEMRATTASYDPPTLSAWHYYTNVLSPPLPLPAVAKPTAPPPGKLGSAEDLAQVERNPLSRALYCYARVAQLVASQGAAGAADHACYLPACVSLAYICVELREWNTARDWAGVVLANEAKLAPSEILSAAKAYDTEAAHNLNL